MKRILLLICLGWLPLTATAQEPSPTYVIKKGDTLWGVSERFLKDPDYWPSLWSHNPEITNPHFIYPGQEVQLYGRGLQLVPVQPAAPAAVTEAVSAAPSEPPPLPEPQAEIVVKARGGAATFVSSEDLEGAGVLVDTVDSRILMAAGDTVFVDMKELSATAPGDRFTLFAVGRPVTHPVTDEKKGFLVTDLGVVQIASVEKAVATALITRSDLEVTRGARLRPWQPATREIALKRADRELSGTILTGGDGQLALGQYDLIHVDLGARHGLATGNLLHLSRPRQATQHALQEETLTLPDVLLGSAVVVDTRPETATALILKMGNQPVQRGDRVTTATD